MSASPLTLEAEDTLRNADITQVWWSRRWFHGDRWRGDECGCPDDRCAGFHHDAQDDCGCLRYLVIQEAASRAVHNAMYRAQMEDKCL